MSWTYNITSSPSTRYGYPGNATEVMSHLVSKGYSYAAAIGVIANMEHESYINPGQQENGYDGDPSKGYGLVQWTPANSKILAYATSVGGNWYDGSLQMDYFDISVPSSWNPSSIYPQTLEEFKAVADIYTATKIFFYDFEQGTWSDELYDYADYWNNYFGGVVPPVPPTPTGDDDLIPFLLYLVKAWH